MDRQERAFMFRRLSLFIAVAVLAACGSEESTVPETTIPSTAATSTTTVPVEQTTNSSETTTNTTEPIVEPVHVEIRQRQDTRLNRPQAQMATLYSPSNLDDVVPVVVMLHWVGSKRFQMDPLARKVVRLGAVVLNAGWMADLGHPLAGAADAVCAVSYAYNNAATWGGDPERIIIVGLSGGGLVGMLAALAPGEFSDLCDNTSDSHVEAVVGLASDAGTTAEGGIGWRIWQDNPDEFAKMDTYSYIGANPDLIVRFVHGTADPVVPIDHIRKLHEALAQAGYDTQFTAVEGAGHGLAEDMATEALRVIEDLITQKTS